MSDAASIAELEARLASVTAPSLKKIKDALLAQAYKVESLAAKKMINLDEFAEEDPVKMGAADFHEQVATLRSLIDEYKGKNFPLGPPAFEVAASAAPRSPAPALVEAVNAKAGAAAAAAPAPVVEAGAAAAAPVVEAPAPAPVVEAPALPVPCERYFDPCTREVLADFPTLERRVRELKKAQDTTPVGLFGIKNDTSTWDFLTTVFIDKTVSLDDMVSFKIGAGSQAGSDIFEVLCRLFVVFGGVPEMDPLRGPFRFIRKLESSAAPTIYESTEAALRAITCKATSATGISDITLLRTGPAAASSVRPTDPYCESTQADATVSTSLKTYAMSVKWYKNEKTAEHYDLEKLYTAMARIVPDANKPAAIVVFLKSKTDFEIAHNRAYRQYVRGLSNHFYGWVEDVRPFLQSIRHTLFEAADLRGITPETALRELYFTPSAKPVLSLQLHQEIIVKSINNAFERSEDNKYLIGVLPRGGKTYIAGGIIREYMRRRPAGTPLRVFWLTAAPSETFTQVGVDLIQKFEDFKDFDFINVKEAGKRLSITKPNQFFFLSSQLITQEVTRQRTEKSQMRTAIDSLMTGALRPDLVFFDEAHATGAGDHTKEIVDTILGRVSGSTAPFIFLTATYFNILFEYRILRENTFLWDYTDVLHTRGIGTDSDQAVAVENLKSRFGTTVVGDVLSQRLESDDSYDAMAKAYIGFPDLYFLSASFQEETLARFASQNQYRPDSGFKLESIFSIKLSHTDPADKKSPYTVKDVLTTGNQVRADAWKIFYNLVNPRNIISLLTPSAEGFSDTEEGGQPLIAVERGMDPSILGRIDNISRSAESRFRLDQKPTLLMFMPIGTEGTSIFHLQCAWAALLRSHPWWAARYEVACVVDGKKLSDADLASLGATPPPAAEGIHIISTNAKETIIGLEKVVHARNKGLVILAGDKLSMGVSLPCTDVVFLFNSTKAPDDIIQKMYRALTPSPGKKAAFVVDLNPVRTLAATYGYIRAASQDSKTPSEILRIIYDTYSWDGDVFEYSLTKGGDTRPLRFQDHLRKLFDAAEKDKDYRLAEDFKDLEKRMNTELRRGTAMTEWVKSLDRVFTDRPGGTELQIELRDGSTAKVKGGVLVIRIPKELNASAAVGGAGTAEPPAAPAEEIVIENIIELVSDFIKYLAITSTRSTLLEAIGDYETDSGYKRNVTQMLRNRFTIQTVPQAILDEVVIAAVKKIAVRVSEEMFKQIKSKIDDTETRRNVVLKMIHRRITPRKKQKDERGEVFTPIELIENMLSHLPTSIWSDHTKTWLDPANGIGNFPAVVFQKLDEGLAGWEPNAKKRRKHILEKMLYMMELQSDNSRVARRIFNNLCDTCEPNIWTVDTLSLTYAKITEKGWPTKYDIIMGNPPYQSDGILKGGGALWPDFVDFAFDHVKDEGYITYVHPPGWRKYYDPSERKNQGKLWHTVRERGWHLDYINLSDKPPLHFPIVDYYVIQAKTSSRPTQFESTFMGITNKGEVSLSFPFIPNMLNTETIGILEKLFAAEGTPINIIYNQTFKPTASDRANKGVPHYHFTTRTGEQQIYKKEYSTIPEYISKNKVIMTFNGGFEKGRLFAFYSEGTLGTTNNSMYMLTDSKTQGEKLVKFLNSDIITFLMKITQYSASPNHKNEFKILNQLKMPDSLTAYGLTEKETELIARVVSRPEPAALHAGGARYSRRTRKIRRVRA